MRQGIRIDLAAGTPPHAARHVRRGRVQRPGVEIAAGHAFDSVETGV